MLRCVRASWVRIEEGDLDDAELAKARRCGPLGPKTLL